MAHDASTSFTAVPRAAVVAAAAAAASERVRLGERERLGCIVMGGALAISCEVVQNETTLLLDLGKGYISGLYCTNWDLAAQQILVAVVLVRL